MRVISILFTILFGLACGKPQPGKVVPGTIPSSIDFQSGETLFTANTKIDSAFYYFTNVTQNAKDSLLIAMAFTYMAIIQQDAGDHYGSLESALEGLKHLNAKNNLHHYCLSSIYNEIGASNVGLKNYDLAIEYYDLAIKYQQDTVYRKIFLNNKAVAYREKGDYKKAINILQSVFEKQPGNTLDYARVLSNLTSLKWRAYPGFDPVPQFQHALNIRLREANDVGIAASYHHLSDYYLSYKPDSALKYSAKLYQLALTINSAEEKLDALRKLVLLAPADQSKTYFNRYQLFNDSLTTARNKAKNQYALIRYQSEKNKNENLLLQKDNSQKQLQILRQRISIYGIGILVIVFVVWIIWWVKKKRQQAKRETQSAIQESELRTSQKVHDVVASALYRIMIELEHGEPVNPKELADRIERLYERSRDINYEPPQDDSSAADRIYTMLSSFAKPNLHVFIIGNEKTIWEPLSFESVQQIEHVLQELMINMSKHSQAENVIIRFYLSSQFLTISYQDDGKGFPVDYKPGQGLQSTETRIRSVNGNIIFTRQSVPGAFIKIEIPIINS